MSIDYGSSGGNGILAPNGGGVERLGGPHGPGGGGSDDHVVDPVGSAEVQAVFAEVIVYTTL